MVKRLLGKKRKATEADDRLFLTFAGEYVTIMTRQNISEAIETEVGLANASTPFTFNGYLLDFDSKFYYLGDSPDQVTTAIATNEVVLMQEVRQLDVYDKLLETTDTGKMN